MSSDPTASLGRESPFPCRHRRFLYPGKHREEIEAVRFHVSIRRGSSGRHLLLPQDSNCGGALQTSRGEGAGPLNPDELHGFFTRVVVLEEGREETAGGFAGHLAEVDWPFRVPQAIPRVDLGAYGRPNRWEGCGDSWNRLRSHLRVMEDAIGDGLDSILVLEDSVRFHAEFRERIAAFLANVPDCWHQLHLHGCARDGDSDRVRVNGEVVIPSFLRKANAYALHRRALGLWYAFLAEELASPGTPNPSLERRFQAVLDSRQFAVFAPRRGLSATAQTPLSSDLNPANPPEE